MSSILATILAKPVAGINCGFLDLALIETNFRRTPGSLINTKPRYFPKQIPEKLKAIRERFDMRPDEIAPQVGARNGAEITAYVLWAYARLSGNPIKPTCFRSPLVDLTEARRLAVIIKDKAVVAQIDDTRAQLLTDEGRLNEAESVARTSVSSLKKGGHQILLVDSLITHGIVLARLGRNEQARFTFQNAVELAHEADALNKAGLAALTMAEEIDDLAPDVLATAYKQASEWLANCYNQGLLLRFKTVGVKLARALGCETKKESTKEPLFNRSLHLPDEKLKVERDLISRALAKVNGQITKAAKLLGIRYQTLAFIIEARHPDLLKQRTPIHRRPRKRKK